jgi:hypothetical protein
MHNHTVSQNIFPAIGSAGIGTTTPNAKSILEMVSTTKGMLVPRMTKNQRDAILPPATAAGLLIFQTNGVPGFYYYTGTAWTAVTPKAGWSLTGNAGTNSAVNFIGTADAQPLIFKVNSQKAGYLGTNSTGNTAFGYQTLNANTTGIDNTANGLWSLLSNTAGYYNTATGGFSLYTNSDGISNTANGISALRFNTHGSDNTAVGANTLFNNITGYSNVAVGSNALFNNTVGNNLVAIGDSALFNLSSGIGENTAVGSKALYSDTSGNANTANGYLALYSNTMGGVNTASGYASLALNETGTENTAFGAQALYHNTNGYQNTAVGSGADVNSGGYAHSTALGAYSLITASYQVRIGDSYVTSIGGYQSWTTLPSDKRVKKNIKENVPGLAFINKLKPVTYNLDFNAIDNIVQRPVIKDKDGKITQLSQQELDSRKAKEQIVFTGFVAQDVAAAASSINYDFSGVDIPKNDKDIYGLRYSDFVMPLVKAVQELSAKNDELEARLQKLETLLSNRSVTNDQQSLNNNDAAKLEQNAPNPFKQNTVIKYYIPSNFQTAQLIITDAAGHNLKTYAISTTGYGTQMISGINLASGQYQ